MNNDDKMSLIEEGSRNAAMRLRVVAEQGRSGQFSCSEMALAVSAILALRERDRLRADVERHESYGGELEGRLAELAEQVERLTRERDAVCRYAAGFLTGNPEQILENALTVAAYVPSPLRAEGDPHDD
jgi:hypothetical protein